MKQNFFALAVTVFLSSFIIPSKKNDLNSVHSYFEYSFAATSSDGTSDINLEKLSAVYQIPKSKTETPVLNISGPKSAVRLKTGISQFLAHHVDDGTATLTDGIGLYKLKTDKKNRALTLDATGIISTTKVILTFAQIDAQTIKILISNSNLSPGEYAFVEKNMIAANSTLTVWCFGID